MTTPDQLRDIVDYLQQLVQLHPDRDRTIVFDTPELQVMVDAGLDRTTVERLLTAPWWPELVDDVLETPDFVEPEASREVFLGYARDVIHEYIGKRFPIVD